MRIAIIVILSLLCLILVGHVVWRYVKIGKMPPTEETLTLVGVLVAIIAILVVSPTNPLRPTSTPTFGIGSMQISEKDGMVQLYVPAGRFLMGSSDGNSDENPPHEVYLDAYWIDQTEVTNGQFILFLNDLGEYKEGCDGQDCVETLDENSESHILRQGKDYVVEEGFYDHPAILVNWYGASAYCAWAGRALPTEAQWEKAARGVDGRNYSWGNTRPTCQLANYVNCVGNTAPVGSYIAGASLYGALDMAGNVREWVRDWYNNDYYQNSPPRNPLGPAMGSHKVLRGGSWSSSISNVRVSNRNDDLVPASSSNNVGFRCAQE